MGRIPPDIENSVLLREMLERVRQETEERVRQETEERLRREAEERLRREADGSLWQQTAAAVVRAMHGRFKKDVPVDLRERLEKYTQEELFDVIARLGTAISAEEALGTEP